VRHIERCGGAIRRWLETQRSTAMGDLAGGLCSCVVGIAYGLTFAHLIFASPLTPWVSYGLAATFITMAVGAFVMSMNSRLPFVIAGPDGATAAVTAAMVTSLLNKLAQIGEPDDLLAPVMALMAMTTLATGIVLWLIGYLRAGNAIRFIPYPVIGGFLAATGWLMMSGGLGIVVGRALSLEVLYTAGNTNVLFELGASVLIAAAIFILRSLKAGAMSVPLTLLVGIAATHLVLLMTGTDLVTAQNAGWLIKPPQSVGIAATWDLGDLRLFTWKVLPDLSADIFALIFVTTVTMLLNTSGIEFVAKTEVDLQHELKRLGIANLLSGLLGGYVNCTSLSRTTLNYSVGGRGRMSGMVVALVSISMLFLGGNFIAYIPKFILGGLMLNLGGELFRKWIFESRRQIPLLEYVALLAVTIVIIKWGFVAGVLIGIVTGCMMFALSASQTSCIKFNFDGAEYSSSLDRSPEELKTLAACRDEIQGIVLQSYLFFGSTNRLYEFVKKLLLSRPGCRFLLFDFSSVNGIDSSAMHSFLQIKRIAANNDTRLVLVNMPPNVRTHFQNLLGPDDRMSEDFDRAMEGCENAVIARQQMAGKENADFTNWMSQAFGDLDCAKELADACDRYEVREGELIASQGDTADCMHFILKGRVGIEVQLDDGTSTRVRSLGAHTTVGEMGLLTGDARSATIIAEADCVLYRLSLDAFERLKRDRPALMQALLTYVISVMAQRLRFASNMIGVLRR
jgi:SulP family sulfate permease